MENEPAPGRSRYLLPVILIAAVIQGWTLYALHWCLENKAWPANDAGWLFACYALAVFAPLTAQFFAGQARVRLSWIMIAVLCVVFGYFAWHQGAWVVAANPIEEPYSYSERGSVLGFILALIWLIGLPFLQVRLTTAKWRPEYPRLFSAAWRNTFMLAEAALFTGLFWLLLLLWQELFRMLGLNFFRELFQRPMFIYPVTSLVFGVALHLIGSVERLTNVLLEQLLNVLKWLAMVAGVLLVVFTLALILKLPGMISSQDRPINAAWLLWLLACLVLLINAAYRDGSVTQPYPRLVGWALRCAIPLTVVIALTAAYAIGIRINRYGFTVERVWACVVALAGLAYAIGYSLASRDKGIWMEGVGRVNVYVAVALICVLMLALTPALSPYRIAAVSQFHLVTFSDKSRENDALRYLRFESGRYGVERLQQLARIKAGESDSMLAQDAQRVLALKQRWEGYTQARQDTLDKLKAYPSGTTIDVRLLEKLHDDFASPAARLPYVLDATEHPMGLFLDMNGDDVQEFILMGANQSLLYQKQGESWQFVGALSPLNYPANADMATQIQSGDFSAEAPRWRELRIGQRRFRLQGEP
jgi:hypothetical protein